MYEQSLSRDLEEEEEVGKKEEKATDLVPKCGQNAGFLKTGHKRS